jgi:molecular chaperone GrpE (heat shock protein)
MLTLAQAAKETGLTKPAIFKAIKSGKISASKDNRGQWMIDHAELFRVYAPAAQKETGEPHTAHVGLLLKLKELEAKLEVNEKRLLDKDAEIELYRRQMDDLRSERERWRVQAERITRLLTDGKVTEKKRSLWAWLVGKS